MSSAIGTRQTSRQAADLLGPAQEGLEVRKREGLGLIGWMNRLGQGVLFLRPPPAIQPYPHPIPNPFPTPHLFEHCEDDQTIEL